MFDFSKRLEDFSSGKPTGGRGARGKYNRDERGEKGKGKRENGGYRSEYSPEQRWGKFSSFDSHSHNSKPKTPFDASGREQGRTQNFSQGFGPGHHAWEKREEGREKRWGFSSPSTWSYSSRGGFSSGSRSDSSRSSFGGGSRGGSSRPSFGSQGSSFGWRPSFGGRSGGRAWFGGGGRGGRSGGRRLPPQPSYKQYMFTPTDDTGVLKFTPYEVTSKFHDFALDAHILTNIDKKGYEKPTEIQEKTLQAIMDGKDMLGLANTGSGKTAAFLLPLVHRMLSGVKKRMLVMVPTRELADQVQTEFRWIAAGTFLRSTVVVGGASARNQILDIKRGVHCIVATPGRLKDLYDRGVIDFSDYGHVVLDEFDRMLDMGFINDIKEIMSLLPEDKQSALFSATMSRDIEKHVHSFLREPAQVTIKSEPVGSRVAQEVVFFTTGVDKKQKLHDLLGKDPTGKYLIFTRTKHEADRVSDDLADMGYKADALHGDKSQNLRTRVTNRFRLGQIQMLVATDVAARGLDIPDVSHVINYDEPATREDYVHRIGRTARAGKEGAAYTFVKGGEY